jgi:glycosyltransferase involved in cell wall biosynthesis
MMLKNMRLLVVSHSYHSFIKDQLEIIAPRFEHIDVLVRYKPIAEIANVLPIEMLKRHRRKNLIDLKDKPDNIRVIPTPVFYLPTDRGYKRLGNQHFRVVDKVIRKNRLRFDLVQAHFAWSAGYAGAKIKEEYDIPIVVTAHGYDIYNLPFKDAEWRKRIKYALNSADQVVTVSRNNHSCIRDLNIATPVEVIPNGFKSELFYPRDTIRCRRELSLPLDVRIFLTVGNLVEKKGHQYLIRAINKVIAQQNNVLFLIVGSGRRRNKLKRHIQALRLENYVKLPGEKPHSEIPIWINASDVFVLPSLSEGNPTVMFECLSCGKPFVGTEVGGIPEVITSERYGILVPPGDSISLADAILSALGKNWNRNIIAKYAKQFSWENVTQKTVEIYKRLLGV